ncbi:hypothetical protein [Hydrogenophaga sp. T2]|uniref:hypothetical protein n=1 Tax=Hydrogenophaga sp. T2 TaxID=3132823 RepID=UPI003CEB9485
MNQLTLNLEPSTAERFPTLRAFIAHRAAVTSKHLKVQAADLDMAPSTLSRKLNPADGDTQRFNVDDLEAWLASTGEAAAVIEYLASKFMDSDEARRARALSRVEQTMKELAALIPSLKAGAA